LHYLYGLNKLPSLLGGKMKALLKAAAFVTVSAALSSSLFAQWPAYSKHPVPKTANGEVDLNAPTPRTPDGKPDLSGIWQRTGGGGGQRGAAPPAAPESGTPLATFGNAGSGFKDGLPYQPAAADLVKKRMADNSKDNPDAHCLPMGFMQFHNHPEPRKLIQTPDVLLMIYEANSGLRQVFTDGRSLPGKDVEPWWYGYSIGKWEGDTLVVETTGFIDGIWLDVRGSPMTDAARVVERFRRPNYGNLEIEVTVDDPKAYTKPWTVKVTQRILAETELIEFICQDRDATHYVGGK
jgi:hypothetical protein